MILLALATVAVPPPPLAPPLARYLVYRSVERHPLSHGEEVTITSRQRLRFDRDAGGGLVATVILDAVEVAAPPAPRRAVRAAAEALLGVPLRVAIAPDGRPGTVLDLDGAWAAIDRGYRALEATLIADPGVPAADLAAARAAIAAERARSPDARATRLEATILPLLPPPLPALRPGEARPLATTLPGPAGAIAARGSLRLETVADATLLYRTTILSDPAAGSNEAVAKAGLELDSAITLDRATGLVERLQERRGMRSGGAAGSSLIMDRMIERVP